MLTRCITTLLGPIVAGAAVLGPSSEAAGASCGETIAVGADGSGIFSEAGREECGPGSSNDGTNTGSASAASECTYTLTDVLPDWWKTTYAPGLGGPRIGIIAGDPIPGAGVLYNNYEKVCENGERDLIMVPIGAAIVNGVVVDAYTLASWARDELTLPDPTVVHNPDVATPVGSATLVNLPTWWWVTNWANQTTRADAGPVWAQVMATPVHSVWAPGDGEDPVTCSGAGLAWRPGMAEDDPRACRYTYARSSATMPDQRFTATVTVTWEITWSGWNSTGGQLANLTTSTTVPIGVLERQALVVGGSG